MNLKESQKIKDLLYATTDKSRGLVNGDGMSAIITFLMLWAKFIPQTKQNVIGFFDVLETLDSLEKFELVREALKKENLDFGFYIDNFEDEALWENKGRRLEILNLFESLRVNLLPIAKLVANGEKEDIEKINDLIADITFKSQGKQGIGINRGILDFSNMVLDDLFDEKYTINCLGSIGTMSAYKFAAKRNVYYYEHNGELETFVRALVSLYGTPFKFQNKFEKKGNTFAAFPFGLKHSELFLHVPFSETNESQQISDLHCKSIYLTHENTENITIAITTTGTLFSEGKGVDFFRKKIVDNNWLDAIIQLPQQIFAGTSIPGILLILRKDRKENEKIQFIDFSNCKNEENAKRGQLIIPNKEIENLFKIYKNKKNNEISISVNLNEIKSKDYKLTVGRYLLSQEDRRIKGVLSKRETVPLNSLVSFIRPLQTPSKKVKSGEELSEILISDINYIGEITEASKKTIVSEEFISKSNLPLVKENDLVISIKGTLGKVGIITKDLENTIPGTSLCILRPHTSSIVPGFYIFQYLRSSIGQTMITSSSQGVAIPFLSIKDLKNLSIPIPTAEERKYATKIMKRSIDLFESIKNMQLELNSFVNDGWMIIEKNTS